MPKNIPTDRFFTKDHEWIKDHKEYALIGITDYAQHCLGDVVYVEIPKIRKQDIKRTFKKTHQAWLKE